MEDADSDSGSQNGLQTIGVDVEDSSNEYEGAMVTLEKPGIPADAHFPAFLFPVRLY